MSQKLLLPISLCLLLIASCCKPPETEMQSTIIPNTYTGLDSLYSRMAANDTVTTVCYGNSITYGGGTTYPEVFQNLLQQEYNNTNITVINEGHPGWTAEMAAGGMDTLVLPHQPDLVTIIFGINDLDEVAPTITSAATATAIDENSGAGQVVYTMEDAFERLRKEDRVMPRAVNFVSGPSRTADIEQTIVLGAHGPYRVHLILVGK